MSDAMDYDFKCLTGINATDGEGTLAAPDVIFCLSVNKEV